MKTAILSVMLTLAAASTFAAPQSKATQDKPWRIYTLGASMSTSDNVHSFENDYYYPDYVDPVLVNTIDYQNTSEKSVDWLSGLGGGGTGTVSVKTITEGFYPGSEYASHDNISENDSISLDWTGTGAEYPFTHNWGSDYEGTAFEYDYDYSGGGTFFRPETISSYVGNEHCDVTDPQAHPPFWEFAGDTSNVGWELEQKTQTETYKRNAQAIWHVQTGGKSIPGQQSLWRFSATASAILEKRATPPFKIMYPDPAPQPIPSTQIAIGSAGQLGTDANLWVAIPDDTDKDITPMVAGNDFYTFNVGGQKYSLTIKANGNDLSVTNPQFCVGQKVTFEGAFSPNLPATSVSPIWNYSLDYINTNLLEESGQNDYYIAEYLKTVNPSPAWFYNQKTQDGTAFLGMNCMFSNGQTVYLPAKGVFNVFTPSISFSSVGTFTVNVRHQNVTAVLFGIGQTSGQDSLSMSANINSIPQFQGQAIATQLVNRQYSVDGISFGTGGLSELDNTEIYPNSESDMVNDPNNPHSNLLGTVNVQDRPGIPISVASWATANDQFKTYFRFKPSGDSDNIYVTLGYANWGWHGNVDYTGGIPYNAWLLSNWTISGDGTSGPEFHQANDFPSWSAVYSPLF